MSYLIAANASIELINDYREYVIDVTLNRTTKPFREWLDDPVLCDQELVAAARLEGFLDMNPSHP